MEVCFSGWSRGSFISAVEGREKKRNQDNNGILMMAEGKVKYAVTSTTGGFVSVEKCRLYVTCIGYFLTLMERDQKHKRHEKLNYLIRMQPGSCFS